MANDIKTRPLTFTEIVRLSLVIYRKYFKYIVLVCLFVFLPLSTITALIPQQIIPTVYDLTYGLNTEKLMYFSLSALAINAVFTPLATASVTYIAWRHIDSAEVTIQGILDCSLLRWAKHIFTAALFAVVLVAGAMLIIPALYFAVAFAFYESIVALTGKWGLSALSESRRYVRGKWFRTFGFLTLVEFMSLFVSSSLSDLFITAYQTDSVIYTVVISVLINIVCIFFKINVVLKFLNYKYLTEGKQEGNQQEA